MGNRTGAQLRAMSSVSCFKASAARQQHLVRRDQYMYPTFGGVRVQTKWDYIEAGQRDWNASADPVNPDFGFATALRGSGTGLVQ